MTAPITHEWCCHPKMMYDSTVCGAMVLSCLLEKDRFSILTYWFDILASKPQSKQQLSPIKAMHFTHTLNIQ